MRAEQQKQTGYVKYNLIIRKNLVNPVSYSSPLHVTRRFLTFGSPSVTARDRLPAGSFPSHRKAAGIADGFRTTP
jgi:hypothetical protein